MRPPKEFPIGTAKRMQVLLKQADRVADQRRIQAVLMRALDESPPETIAAVTGLSINTVRIIHSRFLREGESFLLNRAGRGGRRHVLLDDKQLKMLLTKHEVVAGAGHMLEIGALKRDLEKEVGHVVAASSVYRMLARAGWRKVVPRPSHPKKAADAEAAFKKSSRRS